MLVNFVKPSPSNLMEYLWMTYTLYLEVHSFTYVYTLRDLWFMSKETFIISIDSKIRHRVTSHSTLTVLVENKITSNEKKGGTKTS